jgi:hypothetical protein
MCWFSAFNSLCQCGQIVNEISERNVKRIACEFKSVLYVQYLLPFVNSFFRGIMVVPKRFKIPEK